MWLSVRSTAVEIREMHRATHLDEEVCSLLAKLMFINS